MEKTSYCNDRPRVCAIDAEAMMMDEKPHMSVTSMINLRLLHANVSKV